MITDIMIWILRGHIIIQAVTTEAATAAGIVVVAEIVEAVGINSTSPIRKELYPIL